MTEAEVQRLMGLACRAADPPQSFAYWRLEAAPAALESALRELLPATAAPAAPEVPSLRAAAEKALHEMCNTSAPRESFTDAVDALGAALSAEVPADARDAAARDVLAERRRQVEAEGWTPEHDDEHDPGELSAAGAAYALAAADELHPYSAGDGDFKSKSPDSWPWAEGWWKPGTDPRRMLVKAGALILAEIERLDRAAMAAPQPNE